MATRAQQSPAPQPDVPPRPTGSRLGAANRQAQDAWDREYGSTYNPDGTVKTGAEAPARPTGALDVSAKREWDRVFGASHNPDGTVKTGAELETAVAAARVQQSPARQATNATGTVTETSVRSETTQELQRQLGAEQARIPPLVVQQNDSLSRTQQLQQQIQQQQDIIDGLDSPQRQAPPGLRGLAGPGSVPNQRARAVARLQIAESQLAAEFNNLAGIEAELQQVEQDIQDLQDPIDSPTPSPEPVRIVQNPNLANQAAAADVNGFETAAAQAAVSDQRLQAANGDWRVKLRLAGLADYLYKSADPGILSPLRDSDGVVFPYTPRINTNYTANYSTYDLTHSNYRGYFYQNSYVNEITLDAEFTAQDTFEANYLLAVIHFFRSVTKMFYGQDTDRYRGAPPPLVFLQGLGGFQFNMAPCLVQNFTYMLPNDVDYIRANVKNSSTLTTALLGDQPPERAGTITPSSALRLNGARIPAGGIFKRPDPRSTGQFDDITYVPTKMDISLTLYPVQTRNQVSREFSYNDYANGRLIKRGFW
jgi:hypothetical protein